MNNDILKTLASQIDAIKVVLADIGKSKLAKSFEQIGELSQRIDSITSELKELQDSVMPLAVQNQAISESMKRKVEEVNKVIKEFSNDPRIGEYYTKVDGMLGEKVKSMLAQLENTIDAKKMDIESSFDQKLTKSSKSFAETIKSISREINGLKTKKTVYNGDEIAKSVEGKLSLTAIKDFGKVIKALSDDVSNSVASQVSQPLTVDILSGSTLVKSGVTKINAPGSTYSNGVVTLPVGGAAAWGSITGTLSTQTDLQTALDAKQYKVFYTVGFADADYIVDGVADNVQIQQAIDAASAAGGGVVFVKNGTYNMPGVIVPTVATFSAGLFAKSNVTILGESKAGVVFNFLGANQGRDDGISIGYNQTNGALLTITNFSVENLTLNGNALPLGNFSCGIRNHAAVDFSFLSFKDLNIINWAMQGGIGIGLTGGGSSAYVTCENIYGNNILRDVVWFSLVDYLTINQTTGENIVGDVLTDEGGVVQVESGRDPIITNTTGVNIPYQILLLGGVTRGIVDGVRGTYNLDGIYIKGADWHVSNVRLEMGTSPAAITHGIRYDKTITPGQPHAAPVESTNYYLQFSDIWLGGGDYGIYFNASAAFPCVQFQFDRVRIEGMTSAAVFLTYCSNFTFNEFQTLSNTAVFQLDNSTAQVLGGSSSETSGAYINSIINGSVLYINRVYGQTDTVDSSVVHIAGAETITGAKTFSSSIASTGIVNTGTISSTAAISTSTTLDLVTTTPTAGIIKQNSNRFMHSFGGSTNLFAGQNAGNLTLTGISNTGIGNTALQTLSSGTQNVAVGSSALSSNSIGSGNVAVGHNALGSATGDSNTAVGSNAIGTNSSGTQNTAVGRETGFSNNTGGDNTLVGFQAGRQNVGGSQNTIIGSVANYANSGGSNNTVVGYQAGRGPAAHNTTGNALLGHKSGFSFSTGADNNTMIGFQAGLSTTSGATNTFLGYLAGQNNTTGTSNLTIGNNALVPTPTASNQLNIANAIFGTGLATSASTSVIPAFTGNLGIGTSTPNTTALVDFTSTSKGLLFPRMTTAQKTGMANVAGMVVFDTTLGKLCVNNGTTWETITSV